MPYHRSEEHTSELQSHSHLVCRLLLEKKKKLRTTGDPGSHMTVESKSRRPPPPRVAPPFVSPRCGPCRCAFCPISFFSFFFLKKRPPPKFSPFPHPAPFPI